jgi:predicted Zn-dependent peptidase
LATVSEGVDVNRTEADLLSAVDELRTASDDDVARAVSVIESRHLTDLQRVDHRADVLSMMTTLFDDPARINTEIDRYRAVTTSDVREFAGAFLGADNRAVLTYLPKGD